MILIGRQALSNPLYSGTIRLSTDHKYSLGDDSAGETPDPIPNSVVKPCCADGTALETRWESRKSPGILGNPQSVRLGVSLFLGFTHGI